MRNPKQRQQGIVYSLAFVDAPRRSHRVAHAQQSSAADRLLAKLQEGVNGITARSKSHSRSLVAAALGSTPGLALGIDVEYLDPERKVAEIADFLAWRAGSRSDFYRGWSFAEAFFKAFQRRPEASLVSHAMAIEPSSGPVQIATGIRFFEHHIDGRFQLALVWSGHEPRGPIYIRTGPNSLPGLTCVNE